MTTEINPRSFAQIAKSAKTGTATKGGSLPSQRTRSLGSALMETSAVDQRRIISAPDADGGPASLSTFQHGTIDLFIQVAQLLGLPRSFGEIFGIIFSTEAPLCLDEIATRLSLSRGSSSQGLRWLRTMGAISRVYVPGDRREHFTAETGLRQLVRGFLRETIEPHLRSGVDRLEALQAAATELDPADRPFALARQMQLRRWHTVVKRMLPLLLALAGKEKPAS